MPRRRRASEESEQVSEPVKSPGAALVDRLLAGERMDQVRIGSSKEFWRLVREYPDKSGLAIYLYRLEPVINRSLTGNKDANIEIITPEKNPDDDYVLNHHGSGKYKVHLSDANRGSGYTGVAFAFFELSDPQRPPVLLYEELVLEDRKNSSYIAGLRARGILPAEGENMTADSKAVEEVTRLARDILADKSKTDSAPSGADHPNFIVAIAKLLEVTRPASSPDPMQLAIQIAGLAKQEDKTAPLVPLLLERLLTPPPPPPSDLEQMEKFLAVADRLRGGAPADPAAGNTSWVSAIMAVPAILRELRGFTPLFSSRVPAAAAAAVADPPAPTPQANPAGKDLPPMDLDVQSLMQVGQSAVQAYQGGRSGEEFAAALLVMNPAAFTSIRSLGFEPVYGALRQHPELASLDGPDVREWLKEFFEYKEEDDEDSSTA